MTDLAKLEPVRLYAIAAAILALVAYYVPGLPDALILTLVAALLGIGVKPVRNAVTPVAKQPVGDA